MKALTYTERLVLGRLLGNWHAGQGDPVYKVGSVLRTGARHPYRSDVSGAHYWIGKDKEKLKKRLTSVPFAQKRERKLIRSNISELTTILEMLERELASYPEDPEPDDDVIEVSMSKELA